MRMRSVCIEFHPLYGIQYTHPTCCFATVFNGGEEIVTMVVTISFQLKPTHRCSKVLTHQQAVDFQDIFSAPLKTQAWHGVC